MLPKQKFGINPEDMEMPTLLERPVGPNLVPRLPFHRPVPVILRIYRLQHRFLLHQAKRLAS